MNSVVQLEERLETPKCGEDADHSHEMTGTLIAIGATCD